MSTSSHLPLPLCLGIFGFCGGGLLVSSTVQAQQPGPVALAYKYAVGQSQRFSSQVKTEATFSLGNAGGLGPIPVTMDMTYGYSEKIIGTKQGTATLSALLQAPTVKANVIGQEYVVREKGGKTVVTVNGEPAGEGNQPGDVSGMLKTLMQSKKGVLRRDAMGGISPVSGAAAELGALLSSGMIGPMLRLPEQPVSPGDTWEFTQKYRPSVPGPVPSLGGDADLDLKLLYTFKSLEKKGGKEFALIETVGSAQGNSEQGSTNVSITATSRFDIARGAVVSSKVTNNLNMAGVSVPGNAAAGGGQASSSQIDAVLDIVVREVPPTPAKSAPKKKKR